MPVGEFIFMWKKKRGKSRDDMSQYRALCLGETAMKLVVAILLSRLIAETQDYLPVTHAGFRRGRGVRDNCFVLRSLIDLAVELGKNLVITFIDPEKAFDTISHAHLEEALFAAGASVKGVALFRAIYSKARGRVRVTGTDGRRVVSREFEIRRGVLQGDLVSPMYFIIALEHVFRSNDIGGSGEIIGLMINNLFQFTRTMQL